MLLKRTTSVQLRGRGALQLRPTDHIATGGEGALYRSGMTVVKLYLDQTKMAREGIDDKITLLAKLRHPYVVAPRGVVEDTRGKPIGWYMDYADGEPLARAFTNDWRQHHAFGASETSLVAQRMMEVVQFAHAKGAVMADANELNWILTSSTTGQPEPRSLDVDSWAIGRWPAKAIMPSIRDYSCANLTSATDWFAWGIVTFQLYTGIHPYKGTLAGYKPGELERRMRENASVFAPNVRLNRAVRDFSTIPNALLEWYRSTFQDGQRNNPPSPFARPTVVRPRATTIKTPVTIKATSRQNRALTMVQLYDGSTDHAIRGYECGVIQLASGRLYDLVSNRLIGSAPLGTEVIRVQDGWLVAHLQNGRFLATFIASNLQAEAVATTLGGTALLQTGNRLFIVNQGLHEVRLMRLGRPVLATSQTWGAASNAEWFQGLGVQRTQGAVHLILPFGDAGCAHMRVPELDGRQVISAVAGARFASLVVLDKDGAYRKLELSFDRDYRHYALWTGQTDDPQLNLAILPRGVVATIVRDGELSIFVPSTGELRTVQDTAATTALKLSAWDNAVVALRDGSVWKLSLQA